MFVLKSLLQLILIAIFAGGFGGIPTARAGDVAHLDVIGFSSDGGHFAFEQYGRQAGSGFPYSEIFVIDTKNNIWVGESPFEVLLKDEQASLMEARVQGRAKATSALLEYGIKLRGMALASNPVTELDANPSRVRVNPRHTVNQIEPALEIRLNSYSVATARCRQFTQETIRGFRLTIGRPNKRQETVHQDARIPKSRGCPLKYAIREVFAYRPAESEPVVIVLVSVFRLGFEGPDVRYIAVPLRGF